MSDDKTKEKKYASIEDPVINAVVKSLFRFTSEVQAFKRIAQIKEQFVVSKQTPQDFRSVIIWVRGFEVSEKETQAGYVGNFVHIFCQPLAKKFTLSAKKIETELQHQPQRKRQKKNHPDWGHPILRDIKKETTYESMEVAARELMRLHEQFPEVSIPGEHTLLLIVYERIEDTKSPVQKYKFEVKALPEGGFYIDCKRNTKAKTARATDAQSTDEGGYFTAMVKLKRSKKKKPVTPLKSKEE